MVIPPFTPCPATGDAFIGRRGLVRNLRGRIARGESLAVIGGPKLGKTSLVRTALQALTDHTVLEIDVGADPSPRIDVLPGAIVVLDNPESVADSAIESLLARVLAAKPASIVATGGRRLRTMLGRPGTLAGVSFRVFPLSVLLDGEVRRLIGRDTSPAVAAWTGNHPYLTKLLLHYMDRGGDENHRTLEHAVASGRCQWEPFVQRLAAESGEGPERRLLCYLIERGKPVNPTLAQSDTGIRDMKAVADTLASLGVISRWIRNKEATLFAGCRLLNDFITAEVKNSCPALDMMTKHMSQVVELRASYRYVKEHPWVVQAITGFLSAYFMEKPEFRVQQNFVELESGMHVWVCDIPPNMKVLALLKRLQADLPPCRYKQTETDLPARPQYVIDCPETEPPSL